MSRYEEMGDYALVEHITSEVAHSGAGLGDWPTSAINELHRRLAARARLATSASAPVGETTDTERLDALEAGEWTIHCNFLGPDHPDNWVVTEDHFDGDDRRSCGATLRQAIDTARAAERRDQEEGR